MDGAFLTEEPESTPEELAEIHARFQQAFGESYTIEQVMVDAAVPHIASPDVHVDHDQQRIVMYFHGLEDLGVQVTRVATSVNGIDFQAAPEVLGSSYFRVFDYDGWVYALVMPGRIMRSRDGFTGFERGPRLFQPEMRHSAVVVRGDTLHVLWSRVGDSPESILHSTIDLSGDWMSWDESEPTVVLTPELSWEGAGKPIAASERGAIDELVHQLRDPCLFDDGDRTLLLYASGGESAIGLAEIDL